MTRCDDCISDRFPPLPYCLPDEEKRFSPRMAGLREVLLQVSLKIELSVECLFQT